VEVAVLDARHLLSERHERAHAVAAGRHDIHAIDEHVLRLRQIDPGLPRQLRRGHRQLAARTERRPNRSAARTRRDRDALDRHLVPAGLHVELAVDPRTLDRLADDLQ
jgi:hypothetical protein